MHSLCVEVSQRCWFGVISVTICSRFSISELNAFNMERTITIRGSLDNISQAEQRISGKLRQCWESDMANAVYTQICLGGLVRWRV